MRIEREIHRIISGKKKLCFNNGDFFFLRTPTNYHKYIAEEIYDEVYKDSDDIPTEIELFDSMIEKELWSNEEEARYKSLPKDIEEVKLGMYENLIRPSDVKRLRKVLDAAKTDLISLYNKKYSLYHACKEGYASIEKNKYLVAASLYKKKCILSEIDYSIISAGFIEEAAYLYKTTYLDDDKIREIAKSSQWRYLWATKKFTRIFDNKNLSDEQRSLINWSMLYDNIYEHQECPSDDIIEDNDLLDGWMICQKRKREKDKGAQLAESLLGDKFGNANEVFIPAKTKEDIAKIKSLNSDEADTLKRRRMNFIRNKGEVLEAQMPDSKQKIYEQFMSMRKG